MDKNTHVRKTMVAASDQTKLVLHKADCIRGPHAPRPLVTPIYNSSTYILESAEEGKTLSNTDTKVRLSA